jgi:hypothetical protein
MRKIMLSLISLLFMFACSTTSTDRQPSEPAVSPPSTPIPLAIPKPPSFESLIKSWTIPTTGKQFDSLIGMKGIGTIEFVEQGNTMEVRIPLDWDATEHTITEGKVVTLNAIKRAYSNCDFPQLRYTFVRNGNSISLDSESFYCGNKRKDVNNNEATYLSDVCENVSKFNASLIDRFAKDSIYFAYVPPQSNGDAAESVVIQYDGGDLTEHFIKQCAASITMIIGNALIPEHTFVIEDKSPVILSNIDIDTTHYFTGRRAKNLFKKECYYEEALVPFEKVQKNIYIQKIKFISLKTNFEYAKIVINSEDFLSPLIFYLKMSSESEQDKCEPLTPEQFQRFTVHYLE